MSLAFCDPCGAPMCNYSHHRADSCSTGCETDACLLCGMFPPSADELLEEICALGEHINDPRVQERIILLSDRVGELDARERRRLDDERYPRSAAIDRRNGL